MVRSSAFTRTGAPFEKMTFHRIAGESEGCSEMLPGNRM
jgi:hypothetical protein